MFKFSKDIPLTGFTVVIPSLSVGNVPQLAVDLLVETLKMEKIGFNWSSGIVPVIGPPAFKHESQDTSSCELFVSEQVKVAAVQLRAPVAAKRLDSFITGVVEFLKEIAPARVIILGSCFAHERHDEAIGRKVEYVATESFIATHPRLQESVGHSSCPRLIGHGFAVRLFEEIAAKLGTPTAFLFAYVSEGDNVPDAKLLTLFLNRVTGVIGDPETTTITPANIPESWKLLFGNACPIEMF